MANGSAIRAKRAPLMQTPNMRHDAAAEDTANEQRARKRQRRDVEHLEERINEHEIPARKIDPAPAGPLGDTSRFATPPSAGDAATYTFSLDRSGSAGQELNMPWHQETPKLGIGEDLTQGLTPAAWQASGIGGGVHHDMSTMGDAGLQQVAYSQADMDVASYIYPNDPSHGGYPPTGSYSALGVGGMPGPSINPAPAPAPSASTHALGLDTVSSKFFDHLPPPPGAQPAGLAYTSPSTSELSFAGLVDNGALFSGNEGVPFKGLTRSD